jgi:hypothetical protein
VVDGWNQEGKRAEDDTCDFEAGHGGRWPVQVFGPSGAGVERLLSCEILLIRDTPGLHLAVEEEGFCG